ncbi:MAG: DNA repair protein RecO [Lachnospiraceae bacterium]|nr:DNA repair protein RecO [Lachnospiraceae bacterium]
MKDLLVLKGIIIKAENVNDYDRRLVILTDKRGKISAFVRGARKPNSRFIAASNPLNMCTFYIYEGRNSYSVNEIEVTNYFDDLKRDYDSVYMAMYFCEMTDYYARENNDELELLKLLYQSLRALESSQIPNDLVRAVWELKSLTVNGEYAGALAGNTYDPTTLYAIDYIIRTPVKSLYTFTVKEKNIKELLIEGRRAIKAVTDHEFKSLEMIN